MTRAWRLAAALPLVAALIAGVAACGVQEDDRPRGLAADEVPYGLLDDAPANVSTSTTAPAVQRVNVAVYFLVGDRLEPVPRTVADPPTVARTLNALLEGPTEEEAVSGLRTAINPSTEISASRASPDVVIVDLSSAFTDVPTQEQRIALAQLVFTATGIAGINGVRFTLAGAPVGVPLPDGTVTSEPVGRDAFPNLVPPQPPAPNPA
ncbi:MAG TPA: GerMN domain-containing protein [Acidimicrobiales bacterium]